MTNSFRNKIFSLNPIRWLKIYSREGPVFLYLWRWEELWFWGGFLCSHTVLNGVPNDVPTSQLYYKKPTKANKIFNLQVDFNRRVQSMRKTSAKKKVQKSTQRFFGRYYILDGGLVDSSWKHTQKRKENREFVVCVLADYQWLGTLVLCIPKSFCRCIL